MMAAGRPTRVLEPGPLRDGLGALGPLLNAGAPAVAAEKVIQIPGPAGNLRARVFWPGDPQKGPYPVLVYFHGGGYVVMSADTHEKLTKQLCNGIGAVVVSVDYRLSPEARTSEGAASIRARRPVTSAAGVPMRATQSAKPTGAASPPPRRAAWRPR